MSVVSAQMTGSFAGLDSVVGLSKEEIPHLPGITFGHLARIWLLILPFKEKLKDIHQWKIRIFRLCLSL
jgi:hypothetical protein